MIDLRGDTYRARALALLQQLQAYRLAFYLSVQLWEDYIAAEARAARAEGEAAEARALLVELPKHVDQDYFYDQGFMKRVSAVLAAAQASE